MKTNRVRRFAAALIGGVLAMGLIVPSELPSAIPHAAAADLSGFQPGNIISDEIFFNSGTMTASDIQAFLNSKVSRCQTGYVCLKDYSQATFSRAADPMCGPYLGSGQESAATIIHKVAVACGVNPQVLLVTLQKEQSLVSTTAPRTNAYRSAMGYGCPDTAPCDAEFFGFYNQVYKAAWAFRRYSMPAGTGPGTGYTTVYSRYAPGKYADVLFSPDGSCGTSRVFIQNQATASLYFYTPYQPNAASLAAGYGIGDGCSTYGNRNFYNYFTDWFGSTTSPVSAAIVWKFGYSGGASGLLGEQIGTQACGLRNEGCWQAYANGAIYASRDNPPRYILNGAIRTLWSVLGYEHPVGTSLGYPSTDTNTGLRDGGSWQGFENAAIYSSPGTGTFVIKNGPVRTEWARLGYEYLASGLGYPLNSTDAALRDGGAWQQFERGAIYYSPVGGARVLEFGPIRDRWISQGYEGGPLGYPTGSLVRNGATAWQSFEGGALYQDAAGVITVVPAPLGSIFVASGGDAGPLGRPIGDLACGLADSGCAQPFQTGVIVYSATHPAQAVSGGTYDVWRSLGAETGALGYPTGSVRTGLRNGGSWQPFDHGAIYSSPAGGSHALLDGPIRDAWVAQNYEKGQLGYPVGDLVTTGPSSSYQEFENGLIVRTGATVRTVPGALASAYLVAGGPAGALGAPTGNADTRLRNSGSWQPFQNGALYASASTGAHVLLNGSIRQLWIAQDYEKGPLGYPRSEVATGLRDGGSWQDFENGAVYSGPPGTFAILNGRIRERWIQLGWETTVPTSLGYPTGRMDVGLRDGGSWQAFEKGAIYSSTRAGTHVLLNGPIRDLWIAQDYEKGALGYATTELVTGLRDGGSWQGFENGAVYSSSNGTYAILSGKIRERWEQLGWENPTPTSLGYPVTRMDRALRDGGSWQGFEKGAIYSSVAGGTRVLLNGPIRNYWIAQNYEKGALGYPTSDSYAVPGGTEQKFERGTLRLNSSTGVVTKVG